ncbi:MAG: GerAB/ArcD/ProY family transporter [Bacilli bacterium]
MRQHIVTRSTSPEPRIDEASIIPLLAQPLTENGKHNETALRNILADCSDAVFRTIGVNGTSSLLLVYIDGLQSLSRCTMLLGPLTLLALVGDLIFNIPNVHFSRLLPVYAATGPQAILAGSLPSLGFVGQTVLVSMFAPFMQTPKLMTRYAVLGVLVAGVFLTMTAAVIVAMFGPDLSSRMWNPFFDITRYISIADIFQNVEAVVILVWFLSAFVRVAVYLFVATYGWARLFRINHWQPLLWVVGPLSAAEAFLPNNIVFSSISYTEHVIQLFVTPVLVIAIPLLLWITAVIRGR